MWERAASLEWWLREYGVTPSQVRDMPAWFVARVPGIAAVRAEVMEDKQRQASRG